MSHQQVQGSAGWTWITRGWGLFTRSPGLWVVLALILGVIYLVLNLIPLAGPIIAAVLGPALFGGMIYGARELDSGRVLEPSHLFQAFRESGRAGPMLVLGLVPLAAVIVTGLLSALLVGGVVAGGGGADTGLVALFLMLLLSFLVGLATAALLLFAVPRVMLGLATPVDALTQSLVAVRDNLSAFLVFAVIYFLLALAAMIPLGLGFLILLPVIAGAVHAAHQQVFGDDAGERLPEA